MSARKRDRIRFKGDFLTLRDLNLHVVLPYRLFSMKGKVTAITGGGGGIGFAAAEAIAEAGGDVALLYRSAPNMDERASKLGSKFGVKCKAYKCEVTEFESVEQAVKAVKADFGRLDCFIANAGGGVPGSIDENYDLESWNKTMSVNLHSTFYAAKAVAPIFREQGSGSFIATTSISASIVNVPYPQAPYNASKAAVVHFCRSLAQDWRKFGKYGSVDSRSIQLTIDLIPQSSRQLHQSRIFVR